MVARESADLTSCGLPIATGTTPAIRSAAAGFAVRALINSSDVLVAVLLYF